MKVSFPARRIAPLWGSPAVMANAIPEKGASIVARIVAVMAFVMGVKNVLPIAVRALSVSY